MKDFFTKRFLVYALKWQVGIIVAVPCMYFFKDYLGWNNISTTLAFQFIGALLFFKIDTFIFNKLK